MPIKFETTHERIDSPTYELIFKVNGYKIPRRLIAEAKVKADKDGGDVYDFVCKELIKTYPKLPKSFKQTLIALEKQMKEGFESDRTEQN